MAELSENEVMKEYASKQDKVYFVANTRVSLDSVVYEFKKGASAESIQRSFPLLSLEEVYGAIAFYLANQKEIDAYLTEGEKDFANLDKQSHEEHQEWYQRLQNARKELLVS